jgi:hypothetical protein
MGDSILVIDHRGSRASLLDADLQEVLTLPFPDAQLSPVLWLDHRTFVGTALLHTPESIGWQLHSFRVEAPMVALIRSFGIGDGSAGGRAYDDQYRWNLAKARDGGFWTSDRVRYRIAHWSPNGRVTRIIERSAEWFRPSDYITPGGRNKAPTTFALGLAEDESGLLWSFVKMAAPEWRKLWKEPPASTSTMQELPPTLEYNPWVTRVEVIDVKSGRVLTRKTLPGDFVSTMTGNRSAWYFEGRSGQPTLRILRLTLSDR